VTTHEAYFEAQASQSNPEFWRRFGRSPVFAGRRVLDFGCGHGAMSLEMAQQGAHVVGIDLDERRIGWAQEHVGTRPVPGSLEFILADVTTLGLDGQFDMVVSKDSFEHIDQLHTTLVSLRDALTPDGEIWAGFSPLYFSPWGDHRRAGMKLPWAHTLPRPVVYAAASRHQGHPVRSLSDIGLNGITPAGFRECVAEAGLQFESLLYNRGDKRLMRTLDVMRRWSWIERYATVGVYAVIVRARCTTEQVVYYGTY
jgi:SAM-dependent methyltransferase